MMLMRCKCPKCSAVFEAPWGPTVIHLGTIKYIKCPACEKRSFMSTTVKDPVTWPKVDGAEVGVHHVVSEEEALHHRINDSKYEK